VNDLTDLDAERAELRLLMIRLERCISRSEKLVEALGWLEQVLRDEAIAQGPTDFNGAYRRAAS
jgi:hypothetical protein